MMYYLILDGVIPQNKHSVKSLLELGLWMERRTGQIRGALQQVGLVALAQRFLVLKWNSARQKHAHFAETWQPPA